MKFGPALRAASGIAVLSIMDAVIKGMAAFYPIFQVAFLRFACGSLIVAGVVAVMRPGWPSRETVAANAIRSVIAVVTAVSFFYALGQLPLAETLVLSFLSPMFIAVFGLLMLKERVDARIIGAIAIGFAGTLIVVLGQSGDTGAARSWSGVGAALLSAVTYALSLVLLRQRAQRDKFLHIVFFQNVGPAVLVAPFAALVWSALNPVHRAWFMLRGVLGFIGHILMATAYAKAEAARLAPLEYTALIWGAAIGHGVFHEISNWATLAGGLLLVGRGKLAARR